ncbi:tetratricopeptide repeat protein [Telmatospirillum sp. J64-1]|uniref:tetratricopeptide repeat protein n=1 Tax=Telmatospirillum sp. J64-1 TaxID=2502183 RepID=UPI00115D325B|nr:tetratricopeptide repeat protein [Telmatospirillum sp. J64-1]
MSVLFKGLQKAAKEHAAQAEMPRGAASFDPAARGTIRVKPRRRRNTARLVTYAILGYGAAMSVALLFFGEDVLEMVAGGPEPVFVQPPPQTVAEPEAAPLPELAAAPESPTEQPTEELSAAPAGEAAEAGNAPADTESVPAEAENNIAALMAEGERARRQAQEERQAFDAIEGQLAGAAAARVMPPRSLEVSLEAQGRSEAARRLGAPVHVGEEAAPRVADLVSVRVMAPSLTETLNSAYAALLRGEYHGALALYSQALAQEPGNVSALLGQAAALQKLQRDEEARRLYERVLGQDPQNREALTNMLALLAKSDPQDALHRLLELSRAAPDFSPVAAQIGSLYGQLGDMPAAVSYLRRAIDLSPGNLLYRYTLAVLYDRGGYREEAVLAYDEVLHRIERHGPVEGIPTEAVRDRARFLRGR